MGRPRGTPPPDLTELLRVEDRLSFVYVERCTVHRDANAITVTDQEGTVHVPAATLGALLLGPGTRVTHAAISLLGDCGATAVWVGENGVRYYAHGRSLARSSRLLEAQARLVSNQRTRLAVARAMYEQRFPGEDVSSLTMSQLRGREGARIRKVYRVHSERTGVPWTKREYRPGEMELDDFINQALTAANSCLYGIVHSVVVALGCAPGLGFIHTGNDRSFVYDVADLYKAEVVIPAAFDVVAAGAAEPAQDVRRAVRDAVVKHRLLERAARDVSRLLLPVLDEEWYQEDRVSLWSDSGEVPSGANYEGDAS
ncbi:MULTISPECIES: type I-E CRISPR-associated endonuclease Cas1e [Kocuria]|uniref:type I-E CRISPR-associated endonuclease Cas1e n=1 Tax=Kocuria TaxID=57493 RepID=UPI0028E61388|nr:type I-E CRISPR-associated endonuclease Cas1e [Kocuria carniphila]